MRAVPPASRSLDLTCHRDFIQWQVGGLGRQHVRGRVIVLTTAKTGQTVTIPILPVLAATLAAGLTGDLAFICGERGNPLTKESFGNLFHDACRAAGVNKRAHGVRKIGATRAAENGATVAELEAIFGWGGGGMAALYTRAADRARLAKGAIGSSPEHPPNILFPHLKKRCGREAKNTRQSKYLKMQWWGPAGLEPATRPL